MNTIVEMINDVRAGQFFCVIIQLTQGKSMTITIFFME